MPKTRFQKALEEEVETVAGEEFPTETQITAESLSPPVLVKITEVKGCLQETYDLAAVIMNFTEGNSKSFAWFDGAWRGITGKYRILIEFQPDVEPGDQMEVK